MGNDVRVVFLGLDAFDARVAADLMEQGELPTLRGLLHDGASVATASPEGVFVTAQWATMYTGLDPSRHGYLCWKHFSPATYEDVENSPEVIAGRPFWEALSDAGQRVALVDVPHTSAPDELNGVLVAEWGCHDRHFGTQSYPAELVGELTERFGAHPVGTRRPPTPAQKQFAPCDYFHRQGRHRTVDEAAALWAAIVDGHDRKRAASLHLLDQGPWDLYMTVFGEAHCTGHQLWAVHDATHPWHEPEARERIGDPLAEIYRRMDDTVAAHLARLGPDTTVYVHLSHGMGAHFDGTHLLDDVLRALAGADGGGWRNAARRGASGAFGLAQRHAGRAAQAAVRRALATPGSPPDLGPDPDPPGGGDRHERPWFAIPNNTVSGAVRFNVIGREARGVLAPGADVEEAYERVRRGLLELVNVDTGEPVVTEVGRVDAVYPRRPGDALPDVFVEWNRAAPIERVWSPRIGLVERHSGHWRTGDHIPEGLLVAVGPGIVPGRRAGRLPVVDVGVTVAAAAGVALPDVDGRPVDFLLPATTPVPGQSVALTGSSPVAPGAAVAPTGAAALARRAVVAPAARLRQAARARTSRGERTADRLTSHAAHLGGRLDLLGDAHHGTRAQADIAHATADAALQAVASWEERMLRVERHAAIRAVTGWVENADVPEDLQVSVVLPTRDRSALVPRAVASVQAQVYGNWQIVAVDDGSVDDTPEVLARLAAADERITVLRTEGVTLPSARNVALEAATGDVIVYLDDDNLFDPLWCKAVVWAFTQRPDVDVLYAARVIDDVQRVERIGAGSMPTIHFEPWDRAALERNNIADMGVMAHRSKLPEAHFDPQLPTHADWDLFLRLTADRAPLELPVVALYYASDSPNRLSDGDLVDLDLVRRKLHEAPPRPRR